MPRYFRLSCMAIAAGMLCLTADALLRAVEHPLKSTDAAVVAWAVLLAAIAYGAVTFWTSTASATTHRGRATPGRTGNGLSRTLARSATGSGTTISN
jgi:hypothetical protein